MTRTCTRCNRPTDTFLCWPCTRALADVLNQIPWLSNKLLVTAHGGSALNKLDERQFFEKSGPIAEDEMQSPVPFNTTATKRLADIRTVLTWWVRDICDTEDLEFEILGASRVYGPLPEGVRRIPANYGATTTDLARWLAHHFTLFMGREDAATACEEIHSVFERGIEAINRRDQGIYVGPCPTITGVAADGKTPTRCREALYARRDANDNPQPHVTCWKCRQRHDVALLRDRIWAQAENFLLTGAEILRVMGELGEKIPKNRFYQWRKDRSIQPRGWKSGDRITQRVTPGAKPVFSLAEVRELAAREGVTA